MGLDLTAFFATFAVSASTSDCGLYFLLVIGEKLERERKKEKNLPPTNLASFWTKVKREQGRRQNERSRGVLR